MAAEGDIAIDNLLHSLLFVIFSSFVFFNHPVRPSTSKNRRGDLRRKFCRVYEKDFRSSHQEVFIGISVLKICNKFTIILRQRCSPVNLLHIVRTPIPKNTSEGLLL